MTTRTHAAILTVLGAALVLVSLPRFNRRDIGIGAWTSGGLPSDILLADAEEYITLVRCFRDEAPPARITAPFAYRLLAPCIAAWFPFEPMTALNVLNLLCLLAALVLLDFAQKRLGVSPPFRLLGDGMFVFSFPLFYYGTIGGVDPVLICLLAAAVLALVTERWLLLVGLAAAGTLCKESFVLFVPAAIAYAIASRKHARRQVAAIAGMIIVIAVLAWLVRSLSPHPVYRWAPSTVRLMRNLRRARCFVAFILSFGIPGLVIVSAAPRVWKDAAPDRRPAMTALLVGSVLSVVLFLFAMVSAYADGRSVWLGYPFAVPLASLLLELHARKRKRGHA
jgi:hypothetical protein